MWRNAHKLDTKMKQSAEQVSRPRSTTSDLPIFGTSLRRSFSIGGIFSIILSVTFILILKYDRGFAKGCDLNTPEENTWTLGQMFAVIMLIGLLLPVTNIYNGILP